MEPEPTANHTAFEVLFAYFAWQGPTQVPFNLPPDLHHLIPLPTHPALLTATTDPTDPWKVRGCGLTPDSGASPFLGQEN